MLRSKKHAVGIVAGEEEKVPIRPKRATKPVDRLGSEAQAPEPPPKPKARVVKPPSEFTGRRMKTGAGNKGKAENFAIDGVGKRWTEDGVKMVSMHWEDYPDEENSTMTEAYARSRAMASSSSTVTFSKKKRQRRNRLQRTWPLQDLR